MAEFKEVMYHIDRMCREERCEMDGCPMFEYCGNIGSLGDPVSSSRIEEAVMKWAAKHPETVYLSWMEYLLTQDGCKDAYNGGNETLWKWMWTTPIPANIAQKLGIEPEEGA